MASVQLQHSSLTNTVARITDTGKPYTVPYQCKTCLETHTHKTYHLHLDGSGEVIVENTVYLILLALAGGIDLDLFNLTVIDPLVLNPPDFSLNQGGTWIQHTLVDI